MRNIYIWGVALLVILTMASCRESSDEVLYYGRSGSENFRVAGSSYEEQFKAFWTAMNSNYPIWDYEERFGIDWDDVYERYLPVFRDADRKFADSAVAISDQDFNAVYEDIMSPLHDGHTQLFIKNIHTGRTFSIMPSEIRYKKRMTEASNPSLTEKSPYAYNAQYLMSDYMSADGFTYTLFNDSIVFLKLPKCDFDVYFDQTKDGYLSETSTQVRVLWTKWFDTIQELHRKGMLKGLVIDVRNNGGGHGECSEYVFGALHNLQFENYSYIYRRGWERRKSGIGRLDFHPQAPMLWRGLEREHATITEPIVVLANAATASTAEHICLDAKMLENAYVVGTRTYGALSPYGELDSAFYTGVVGSIDGASFTGSTPFGIILPAKAFFTDDREILEGVGVTPDVELPFDKELYSNEKRDNQLEYAIDFIRAKYSNL